MTPTALQGQRVLDLSESIAGQYCCRLLADYGASVTLLEPPGGSVTRRMAPCADGRSTLFFHLNTGKRSLVLDAATESGAAALRGLVGAVDVVVVGSGVDRSGFAAANRRCVVAVVSPFGQQRPWSKWEGSELIYQALSGGMMSNGVMGRAPLYGCGHRASFAAGVAAYIGILAALHARERSGVGQEIDVSIAETAATMTTAHVAFAYSGEPERRNAGANQVRCRDGWIVVWIYNHLWKGFCEAIDAPELLDDPRFAHPDDRQRNWAALMRILHDRVSDRAADEVVARLQAKRLIAAKAAHLTELVGGHPHLAERGFFETVMTVDGPRMVLGPPFRMARTPRVLQGDAPSPGAEDA